MICSKEASTNSSAAKSQVIENFVFVRRVNFEKKRLVDKIPPEEKLDWIKINV